MANVGLPKGTRDFSPLEVSRRQYIFSSIKTVFERYGYQPIETPVMELTKTLTGKYGDEGDKLIFNILPRGVQIQPFAEKVVKHSVENIFKSLIAAKELNPDRQFTMKEIADYIQQSGQSVDIGLFEVWGRQVAEESLKYDLTIPFARYVVMHRNDIALPFKRYQIQPVFRADRPQKGRYREFYQCDADVVGSESLWNEAEFALMYDQVFEKLNINVSIRINNRKVLNGLAETIGAPDALIPLTIAIDKLDKVGLQGVRQELTTNGFSESQMQVIEKMFSLQGTNEERLKKLRELLSSSEIGLKGCDELDELLKKVSSSGKLHNALVVDFTLARGLNYYTGTIYEVVANEGTLKSSIGGGGRYDNLTGAFGWEGLTGVGISFGADRIYDVIEELKRFPETVGATTKALFVNFGGEDELSSWNVLQQIRQAGINAELYPDAVKLAKQFKYADAKQIPFTVVIGEAERKNNSVTLKDMKSGEQQQLSVEQLIQKLQAF